jgi:2-furoyl-CoA dehydrogenase 2Fe-2S iron sulfur subunit
MPLLKGNTLHRVRLVVNGQSVSGLAAPRILLSDFLRHTLGFTGTHVGCEHGICGACTVQVDGEPARSCLMLAVQAEGCRVNTVEGLSEDDGRMSVLQDAFARHHALQCGFCTPGVLMSLSAWLFDHPQPDERQVREMLSGHLCRCTGYTPIVNAALEAAAILAKSGAKTKATKRAPEGA